MAVRNYIILNPSGNLFKIGALLKEFGLNVYFFNTGELPLIVPNCVHLIFKDVFMTFDRKNSIDRDDNLSMLIKKGLRSGYKLKKMKIGDRLKKMGIKEGSTVIIGDLVFELID